MTDPNLTNPEQVIDNGNVWTHAHDDVYISVNDNGDQIRALWSDFADEDTDAHAR